MPVLDARVRATIQYTAGDSAGQDSSNTIVVDLLDNGNSDPDVSGGDGVYSRYFANYFRGAGTYSVSLSVDAMNGMAYTIRSYPISTGKGSLALAPPPPRPSVRPSESSLINAGFDWICLKEWDRSSAAELPSTSRRSGAS